MKFSVPEMSCGHCTAAIEKSVKAADPASQVECNLDSHEVSVESSLDRTAVLAAIKEAGYDAEALNA